MLVRKEIYYKLYLYCIYLYILYIYTLNTVSILLNSSKFDWGTLDKFKNCNTQSILFLVIHLCEVGKGPLLPNLLSSFLKTCEETQDSHFLLKYRLWKYW